MKPLLILAFLLSTLTGIAQDRYLIRFTDKNNSPFSISSPLQYLSQRALDRRTAHQVAIDSSDLPVNPQYIQAVQSAGATILNTSKWFNSVIIQTSDPAVLNAVNALPFVINTTNVGKLSAPNGKADKKFGIIDTKAIPASQNLRTGSLNYGNAFNQVNMIGLQGLHDMGYAGEGMLIAVLDAGFQDVNIMSCFDSLFSNGKIVATWDFVDRETNVYNDHSHGTSVLSCMGAVVPGDMIGTAPRASYLLLRSEDANTEYIIEEYNWASAAEYADSAGADIINSSLGYYTFNDPNQDHTYSDMDGNTAPATIAADKAASKGILVVASAGNEGAGPWNYIGTPADGDSVLSIGAVDEFENYAFFSSNGPTSDGRVKPDVAARGFGTWLFTPFSGSTSVQGNGTSFSGPVMAGAAACLWQAWPQLRNMEIAQAIRRSASQFSNPDTLLGYGIPDFTFANNLLGLGDINIPDKAQIHIFPNPGNNQQILVFSDTADLLRVTVFDAAGRLIYDLSKKVPGAGYNAFEIPGELSAGLYFIRVESKNGEYSAKLIRN